MRNDRSKNVCFASKPPTSARGDGVGQDLADDATRACVFHHGHGKVLHLSELWKLLAIRKGPELAEIQHYDPAHESTLASKEGLAPVALVPIVDVLKQCADALYRAAKETAEEADGYPRNLLAAFQRVSVHVDFFLRATNEAHVTVQGGQQILKGIEELREKAAKLIQQIGVVLCCPDGFVMPKKLKTRKAECKRRLVTAAPIIGTLARLFESTREEVLIALPGDRSTASTVDRLVSKDGQRT